MRSSRPWWLLLAVLGAAMALSACELVTAIRINDQRQAQGVAPLATSSYLTDRARERAAAMCAARQAVPATDPAAAFLGEPATAVVELVGRAPLDPAIADPVARNLAAGDVLWNAWKQDPRLTDPRWQSMGVGEHTCPDGQLYSSVILRDEPPPLDAPADTSRIVPAGVVHHDGWTFRRYRNLAAPCAINGFQTFVIGSETGSDPTVPRPLWVRMRGGGVGWFSTDGTPQPSTANKSEESMNTQLGFADTGLVQRALHSGRGFRLLIVSMCSHDIYAGNENYDPYNPNLTPDGHTRPTTGLTATKAAIQFTRGLHATDQFVLHGTSAGGYGVYHVAWALQRQGIPPAAIISDSGVLNLDWLTYVALNGISGTSGCEKNTEERGLGVLSRVDGEILDPANQPHRLLADGRLTVPVMHVWSRGDHALCGDVVIPCPLPGSTTTPMWAADCQHEPVRRAIEDLPPTNPSTYLRLCVEGQHPSPCDRHVPTRSDGVNTDLGAPADYNGAILDWVLDRLGPPN